MRNRLRKYGVVGAAFGVVAGATALALPTPEAPAWQPITRGLTAAPERLLPPVISAARPVRVVSTAVDGNGRPVVTVRTATDRATAARLVTDGQQAAGAVSVELDVPVRAAQTDPMREAQWDLDRIGTEQAWSRSTGAGVTVAVIDSGVETSHPDLAGQVLPGADFITGVEGKAVDPHGHGTHVAGTIAALAGNGQGIAGVAPGARILPVRVLNESGAGYMSDVAGGIAYATDHGADVINMSISATTQVTAVTNAVAYARSKGVVVVAAAGNARRSGSPASFPAADHGVLAVAATDAHDGVAGYSTAGTYVDVSAPGSDIVSTYPIARYGRMSGTSMAAPHVAAVAALLKSRDRALTPDQIEQVLKDTAVDLGVPGRDDDHGAGRIDAGAALAAVEPQPPIAPVTPEPSTPTAEPTTPAQAEPTTAPTPTEPTAAPTTEPAPAPTTTEPTMAPTPTEPTTAPTPTEPATEPAPAPTTANPAPTETASRPSVMVYLAETGSDQLTAAIRGAEGQPVALQQQAGAGWETIRAFPATMVTRLNGLAGGRAYRIVVADSPNFAGATSTTAYL